MYPTHVVVVTGASGGIGRATAVAFARRGAAVALLARGEDGLAGAVKEIESEGGTALAIPTDVADADQVEAAAQQVEDELGPIDVWVNNAMATIFSPISEVSPAEFKRSTEVTYLGQVYGTLAALKRMRARDHGHIVNVGSALAFRGIPLQAPYCGAKFAVRGFTESVRAELLADGSNVRIGQVHLPAVNTPQFDWGRSKMPNHPMPVPPIYSPEMAARAIVRTALDGRRTDILGSWNWFIIQASKVVPGVFDHYTARTGSDSQQTDEAVPEGKPDNLFEPVDGVGGGDHGAHGIFGEKARGVLDPSFLMSLPQTLADLGRSVVDRAVDVAKHPPKSRPGEPVHVPER